MVKSFDSVLGSACILLKKNWCPLSENRQVLIRNKKQQLQPIKHRCFKMVSVVCLLAILKTKMISDEDT